MAEEKRIARVFPRKTKATPDDALVFFDDPPLWDMPEVDEVHISVTFTYDCRRAATHANNQGGICSVCDVVPR